jgi:adenosylcobyric acid synthase
MALNSFITKEGGEIGRAQALQARAARVEASFDMNPILLKVSGEAGSQVIIHGKVHRTMKAREYYAFRTRAWKAVAESYGRLSAKRDLIVIEGAGSPAEINLRDVDIVNMSMAKHAKAPVLLVGDIDKGGVFASLYGTVKLLGGDGRHIKAFIINKFRGDPSILAPGLDMIRQRTGKPVIGVLPYIHDIGLPEEDGLTLANKSGVRSRESGEKAIKVVVVRLKYISNFTDFAPLAQEPDAEVRYSENPAEIERADVVIVPGSKNTVEDLLLLKKKGLDAAIRQACEKGTQVIGICGGYQMLGARIEDPHGAESRHRRVDGIGLLDITTRFRKEKRTCLVEAEVARIADFGLRIADWKSNETLKGYEIHMGTSTGDTGLFKVKRLTSDSAMRNPQSGIILDGSMKGNCWGTYLHGIFENDSFRRGILNGVRKRKGMPPRDTHVSYHDCQDQALNRLAAMVRDHIDMDYIRRMLRL